MYPISLQYKDYPEEAYNDFILNIESIKKETITNIEKWDKKYNLTKNFIEKYNRLPYWWYINLGCTTNREISIKSIIIKKYRNDKLSLLFGCNFIKNDDTMCKKPTACRYDYIKDPFKCSNHLRRCKNCINWIDSHCSNKKYDNYCARCFKRLFPDDTRSLVIYEHSKEILVRNALSKKAYDNDKFKNFIHDSPIYTGDCKCTHRRRIDHRKLFGNTILAIETDEFSHKGYDKKDEQLRYDDLYMIHSGKWIFIRFNPDNTKDIKINIFDRINVLINEIEKQIMRIENEENNDLLEIIYLFY